MQLYFHFKMLYHKIFKQKSYFLQFEMMFLNTKGSQGGHVGYGPNFNPSCQGLSPDWGNLPKKSKTT